MLSSFFVPAKKFKLPIYYSYRKLMRAGILDEDVFQKIIHIYMRLKNDGFAIVS